MRKIILLSIVFVLLQSPVQAQEIVCKVKVLHDKILNVEDDVFRTLERTLMEFVNTRKWTNDTYLPNERIEMNLMLNLTSKLDKDKNDFAATLNIQAIRPVYNTSYTSPLINFIDRDVVFTYNQFTPFLFDDNRVAGADAMTSNLPAIIAYYIYLTLGLDYDSYSLYGGTEFFKKALNIVNNAPEASKQIVGWKASDGNKNRYWITDQILHARFQPLRQYWYSFHREALDSMSINPAAAQKRIADGTHLVQEVNRSNPASILVQFFLNAKSTEIYKVLSNMKLEERTPYLNTMAQLDIPNAARYNDLRKP